MMCSALFKLCEEGASPWVDRLDGGGRLGSYLLYLALSKSYPWQSQPSHPQGLACKTQDVLARTREAALNGSLGHCPGPLLIPLTAFSVLCSGAVYGRAYGELDCQSLKTYQSHLSWPLTVVLRLEVIWAPHVPKGNHISQDLSLHHSRSQGLKDLAPPRGLPRQMAV